MKRRGRNALKSLADDLRDHLERQTEENIALGISPEEARRQAHIALGNLALIEEDTRVVWIWRWPDRVRQDVGYAVRTFRRDWGFTVVTLVTLALGIGAATAIFSIVYAIALKPLPYANSSSLVQVLGTPAANLSLQQYDAILGQTDVFAGIAGAKFEMSSMPGASGDQHVQDLACTPNLFDVLGVRAEVGRTFAPSEAEGPVVVLDHEWWMRQFGGDRSIVGHVISLSGASYQVIGVMPADFRFPYARPADAWIPADAGARAHTERGTDWLTIARFRPGRSVASAQAELSLISTRLASMDPQRYGERPLRAVPVLEAVIGTAVRTRLLLLLSAVSLVVLIACVNVASLLLTRSRSRSRELAVRAAVGASRRRLVQQVVTETVVISLLGGAAGVLLARWTLDGIVALIPSSIPRVGSIAINGVVLCCAFALSLATGVLAGMMPAWRISRTRMHDTLKDGAPVMAVPGVARAGAIFVFAETSLAVVLLIGAALVIHSFDLLVHEDPGFDRSGLVAVTLDLWHRYPPAEISDLLDRARRIPGVRSVTAGDYSAIPFQNATLLADLHVQGHPQSQAWDRKTATAVEHVTPGYFRGMGIDIVRGRGFTERDVNGAPFVAVINDAEARKDFSSEDPIGKRIGGIQDGSHWYQVVGIVSDSKRESLADDDTAIVYFPLLQGSEWEHGPLTLLFRMNPTLHMPAPDLQGKIEQALGPGITITRFQSMDAMIARSLQQSKFQAVLLGLFGALALVLAVVGIFGVTSYAVVQRTHEIGVRLALGAQRSEMLRLIVGSTARPVLAGLVVGLLGAVLATRTIAALLFQIKPTDVRTYAVTAALFLGVALLASAIPAYRASRVDPVVTLRQE